MILNSKKVRRYEKPLTDIHDHILPGLDDGSKDLATSVRMAAIALSEGINRIIATPHFDLEKDSIESFLEKRQVAYSIYISELEKHNLNIEILLGAEVYLTPELAYVDDLDKLCLAGTKYMLVEMPITVMPMWLEQITYALQLKGITPILAHPERSIRVMKDPSILADFVERGVMLQINAGSLRAEREKQLKKCLRYLMKRRMVHFIASDAHTARRRRPRMQGAISILENRFGYDAIEYMLENARALADGRVVDKQPCREYKPGIWEWVFG